MKLHETLVEILLKTYEINSGWTEERKLREALKRLDLSVYTQQDGTQVLVSTQQLNEAQRKIELELQRQRGE
jgi:hypothetical protein